MSNFQFKDFKKLCHQIEATVNRSWIICGLSGENYPQSFYYSKFKSSDFNQTEIMLLCNKHQPIFAIADPNQIGSLNDIDKGFVQNAEIEKALTDILNFLSIEYNILSPELLNLRYNGKEDFKYKLKTLNIHESNIACAIKVIDPEFNKFKLPYNINIGYELFNSFDD